MNTEESQFAHVPAASMVADQIDAIADEEYADVEDPTGVEESFDFEESPVDQPEAEAVTVEKLNEELSEVATEIQSQGPAGESQSNVSEDDRQFWAKVGVIGQIAECQASIDETTAKIDEYQAEIKEEKELLKGEQIRLQRLAGKLAEIVAGKPLPVNPDTALELTAKRIELVGSVSVAAVVDSPDNAWRDVPTATLLAGVSGLGAKKLDTLVGAAPTAGHLEDLRGEASRAHKSFKEMLPKGCGQGLADAIEERLMDCVASNCLSAADQLAAEQAGEVDEEDVLYTDLIPIVQDIQAELQKDFEKGLQKSDFKPADLDAHDEPFVVGFMAFGKAKSLNDCPDFENKFDRDWVMGWLSAQFVDEWDQHEPADEVAE